MGIVKKCTKVPLLLITPVAGVDYRVDQKLCGRF
jgi:hypothetical protein